MMFDVEGGVVSEREVASVSKLFYLVWCPPYCPKCAAKSNSYC